MRKKTSNFRFEKFAFFVFFVALALISAKSTSAQIIMSDSSNILEIKASSTPTKSIFKFLPSTSVSSFSLQAIAETANPATTISVFEYLSSNSLFKMLNGVLNFNPSAGSGTGYIGIGTTAPVEKLHVVGNNYTTGYQQTGGATYTGAGLWFGNNQAVGIYKSTSDIRFKSTSDLMAIAASGNVGIGTTTPEAKLVVSGGNIFIDGAVIGSSTPQAAITKTYLDSSLNGVFSAIDLAQYWKLNGSNLYASSTAWNVGIGTTNPQSLLHVTANSDTSIQGLARFLNPGATTAGRFISIAVGKSLSTGGAGEFGVFTDTATPANSGIAITNWGDSQLTDSLFIKNGGHVGIGTTAPGAFKLYVNGATYTSGNLNVGGDATITGGDVSISNNNGGINFNDASAYWLKTATNYGIYWDTTANQFKFNGAGVTKASIDLDDGAAYFNGSVGIGTIAPGYKLDIAYDGGGVNLAGNTIHNLGAPGTSTDAVNRFYVDSNFAPIGGGASLWATSSAGIYNVGLGKVGIGTTGPSTALQVAGTVTATQFNGSGAGLTGTAASLTAGAVSGLTLNSSAAPIVPDNVTQNQIGYNTGFGLFGASDGGLYSSAYSSAWIHQIYGDFRTGRVAIRGKNSGTWQPWRTVLDSLSDVSSSGSLKITGAGPHYIQNGNVGIGITTPNAGLEVLSGSNYSILAGGKRVGNVAAPVSGTDAVNRNYVDSNFIASSSLPTTTNAFVQNGNSFGAKAILGTNDNQALGIETNGTEKMTILANGSVGIGISNPNQQLEITKNFRLPATVGTSAYGVIYKGWDRFIHDFNYGLNGNGITTNGENTFVGVNAGNFTMGSTATNVNHASYNTGIGVSSLRSNTTGYGNSAVGNGVLQDNTTGNDNTANGVYSLRYNTTGNNNTANGFNSLFFNTTGSNNSALGNLAGTYFGSASARESGDYGLYLGYDTRASGNGMNNEIVIGALAVGHGSNTATYGNTSMTKHVFEAGNVGIGTTNPSYKLDVAYNAQGVNLNGNYLHNVSAPSTTTDAINKGYLDSALLAYGPINNFWKLSGSNLYASTTSWNVGIGTTAPGAYKLYVNGATYTSGNLNVGGDATISGGDVYNSSGDLHLSGDRSLYFKMDYNNNDADIRNIIFAKNTALGTVPTGVNELMRITETGNVGIGLEGANPVYRLDVKGEANFGSSQIHNVSSPTFDTDVANQGYVKSSVEGSAFWKLSGSNVYASSTTWNVGIGTTKPLTRLYVFGSARDPFVSGTDPRSIASFVGDTKDGLYIGAFSDPLKGLWLQASDSNDLSVKYPLTLNPNGGNVGIGTSAPASALHVQGASYLNGQIKTSLTGTGSRCLHVDASGVIGTMAGDCGTSTGGDNLGNGIASSNITLGNYWLSGDGGNEGVFVKSDGNVGVGTDYPNAKLNLLGSASSTILLIDSSNPNHRAQLKVGTGFNNTFFIDSLFRYIDQPTFVAGLLEINPSGGGVSFGGSIVVPNSIYNLSSTPTRWLDFSGASVDSLRVSGNLVTTGGKVAIGTTNPHASAGMTIDTAATAPSILFRHAGTDKALLSFKNGISLTMNSTIGVPIISSNTGLYNIGIGSYALNSGTGSSNIGIGVGAAQAATSGNNVAIGGSAMNSTGGGGNNIAIGSSALSQGASGNSNIAIGNNALNASGINGGNIAIGNGGQWVSSNNKLYIGDLDIYSTHIPLIYGFMTGKSPNQFGMGIGTTTLGTTTAGTVALTVAGDMFATGAAYADGFYGPSAMGSDIRLKHDIKTLSEEDYRKVFKLRPVSFTYNKDNRDDYGFIAQEVQKLYPETVTNGGDGNLYIYYNSLIAPTVAAVQAQEKKIEEQETLINILLDRVNKLENSAK